MAQASRRVRRDRRLKRSVTFAKSTQKKILADFQRTYLTLLYVLAQNGGSITVTHGTMMQVMKQAPHLQWHARDGGEGEVIIEMIEQTTVTTDEPDVVPEKSAAALIVKHLDEEDAQAAVDGLSV